MIQAEYGILLTHTNGLTNGRCSDGTPFRTNRFTVTLNNSSTVIQCICRDLLVCYGWYRLWSL